MGRAVKKGGGAVGGGEQVERGGTARGGMWVGCERGEERGEKVQVGFCVKVKRGLTRKAGGGGVWRGV